MTRFIVTNQHQAEDCPELVDEVASYYDVNKASGTADVYCTCATGEHRMYFLVDANGAAEALNAVPSGFLRTPSTVSAVEKAYEFAAGGG